MHFSKQLIPVGVWTRSRSIPFMISSHSSFRIPILTTTDWLTSASTSPSLLSSPKPLNYWMKSASSKDLPPSTLHIHMTRRSLECSLQRKCFMGKWLRDVRNSPIPTLRANWISLPSKSSHRFLGYPYCLKLQSSKEDFWNCHWKKFNFCMITPGPSPWSNTLSCRGRLTGTSPVSWHAYSQPPRNPRNSWTSWGSSGLNVTSLGGPVSMWDRLLLTL